MCVSDLLDKMPSVGQISMFLCVCTKMSVNTYPCIVIFAHHTETVGQWCLLIIVLSVYIFLK